MDSSTPLHYLHRAEANGYPNLNFEFWYQIGLSCHEARLPRHHQLQTLRHGIKGWREQKNCEPEFWMLRAFAYGAAGRDSQGIRRHQIGRASCRERVCQYV